MSKGDEFDKTSVNNRFMWDDDPFPVWTAGLDGLIWPEPEEGLLQFGLTELDRILGGLRGGSLVVIGGKMGCGKSDLAEMLVYSLCWRQKSGNLNWKWSKTSMAIRVQSEQHTSKSSIGSKI